MSICIESSHMFMHSLLRWRTYVQSDDLTLDVFVASEVTTLRWLGTTCI